MRRASVLLSVLTFLSVPLAAAAATTADVAVEKAGNHYYWLTYRDPAGKPVTTAPLSFKDKSCEVSLPILKDKPVSCSLYVLDGDTGNEAALSIDGKSDKPYRFTLKRSDFDHVREVAVSVTSSASHEPAAAALVTLTDADKRSQSAVIAGPSSSGTVRFADVPTGSASVKVEYGDGKSTTQDIEIPSDRKDALLSVEIPIVGEIETVAASEALDVRSQVRGKTSGTREQTAPSAQGGVSPFSALFGVVILAGVGYGIYVMLRNRGATARKLLGQAGIDLPDSAPQNQSTSTPQSAPVDPTVCPFCGGKKDPTTGACACSVGGAASVSTGSGPDPRLVASGGVYSGAIYRLTDDVVSIGRDESNTIAFPQDSTSSRRHASVMRSGGEFTIRDEGSSNGVYVNGARITQQALRPGDEIQIGGTRLRFEP